MEGHVYDASKLKDKDKHKRNGKVNDQGVGVNARLHESPYRYYIGEDENHMITCHKLLSHEEKRQFREMIGERYRY